MSLYFNDIFRERESNDNHIWLLKLDRIIENHVSLDTLFYRDKPKKRFDLSRLINKYRYMWRAIFGILLFLITFIVVGLLGYFLTEVIEHWLISLSVLAIVSVSCFVMVKFLIPFIKRKYKHHRRLSLMYQLFNLPVHNKDGTTFQFLGAYLDIGYSTLDELIFVLPPDSIGFNRFGANMMSDFYFHSVDNHPDRFTHDDIVSLLDIVTTVFKQQYVTKLTDETVYAIEEMRRIRDKNDVFKRGVGD